MRGIVETRRARVARVRAGEATEVDGDRRRPALRFAGWQVSGGSGVSQSADGFILRKAQLSGEPDE